ncbi:hypothetical protein BYT27DRAFT_7261342 [Phlegmacium glaucopus]|nr:hypothetical protein BYT27DRAFT_7261342 [Phlegmacium glaucopus]
MEGTKSKETVFVGGISEDTDESTLYEGFSTFGVLNLRYYRGPIAPTSADPTINKPILPVMSLSIEARLTQLIAEKERVALVDNTSSEDKAFSGDAELFVKILNASRESGARFLNEATVDAGLSVIAPLKELLATGDRIKDIEGVFSRTMSYIFNEFSTGTPDSPAFSVVAVAREKGYTEPHPADDLNAALEGIPTGDEFIARLPEFDDEFAKLRKEASSENKVLRFVGVVDVAGAQVRAGLEKYPTDHPFATSLGGSDNIIMFHTERYSPRPLIVQGAGAGAAVTAMGVLGDLLNVYYICR